MPDTMIERMAASAWEENRRRCAKQGIHLAEWSDESEELQDDWRAGMRAVLTAMREPAEAMIAAGMDRGRQHWEPNNGMRAAWTAMIDAALKEE